VALWYAWSVTSELAIRTLTPDDWPAVVSVDSNAFGTTFVDELLEEEQEVVEWDRWIGTYDGNELVGVAAIHSFTMTVPGGKQPVAAVTWVAVLPTHRRRGILRGQMTHQLHGLHESGGESVAALWASEPAIYGRFGYGLASLRMTLTVPRSDRAVRPAAVAGSQLRVRLHPVEDWKAVVPAYDAVAAQRPGMMWRDDRWSERSARDIPSMREGASARRCVVAEDANGIRGYARYATKQEWNQGGAAGTVRVNELLAPDVETEAVLLRFLADIDLTAQVELWNMPVDDPAWHVLTDPRRAEPKLSDGLYIRLVDVDRALTSRTFATELDVVLDVADELCPWNAGTWRLAAGADGVTCERTDAEADLAMPVASLGAAYLGGTSLAELGRAGLVDERRTGALAVTSRAFAHEPKPWCAFIF
jgi:predicted acetyltransferase